MRVGTERAVLWYLERGMKVLTEGYDGTHHHKEETYRGACRYKQKGTQGTNREVFWYQAKGVRNPREEVSLVLVTPDKLVKGDSKKVLPRPLWS